jgi:hypothetical protein
VLILSLVHWVHPNASGRSHHDSLTGAGVGRQHPRLKNELYARRHRHALSDPAVTLSAKRPVSAFNAMVKPEAGVFEDRRGVLALEGEVDGPQAAGLAMQCRREW